MPFGIQPGFVLNTDLALMTPASMPAATVSGFIVEPGSSKSVNARLRCASRLAEPTLFGLNEGRLAIASTSPVSTSSTTAEPLDAPLCSIIAFNSR